MELVAVVQAHGEIDDMIIQISVIEDMMIDVVAAEVTVTIKIIVTNVVVVVPAEAAVVVVVLISMDQSERKTTI